MAATVFLVQSVAATPLFDPTNAKMTASGIAVGANKGHVVTKRDLAPRASRRKGVRI